MEFWKLIFYTLAAYLLYPYFFIATRNKKRRRVPSSRPRILVVPILRKIGDMMCATPVFAAIKEKYPESVLAVVVGDNIKDLLLENPRIDELININDTPFKGFWGRGRFFWHIRKQNFDWAIALPANPLHALIAFYSFAPHRVKTIREERSFFECATDFFSNYRLRYKDHTFLPGHYLKLLGPLGISNPRVRKEVFFSEKSLEKAQKYFEEQGIGKKDFVVGMSIAAGNKVKEWGDEKFLALARKIRAAYGAKIILMGIREDLERMRKIKEELKGHAFVLESVPLNELPAIMERLDLFIAADTGLVYIAHALGTPLIDIVGPVDWREQPPEDEKSICVRPPESIPPSSFVFKRPGSREEQKRASHAIAVEDVMRAVLRLCPAA